MKLQYASDLHLEFTENEEHIRRFPLEVAGDILVLAGDTCYLGKGLDHLRGTFFRWCSQNYREVYLIPGNHEFYGRFPLEATLAGWSLDIFPNVRYLNNRSVRTGDSELFFTTMWTRIEPDNMYDVQMVMNDFRRIRLEGNAYRAFRQNRVHGICSGWLNGALRKSVAERKIIVTHHCPVIDTSVERYVGPSAFPAYAVDMSSLMLETAPEYWIHGHVHSRGTDGKTVDVTTVLTNPLGYVGDEECAASFNRAATIEL